MQNPLKYLLLDVFHYVLLLKAEAMIKLQTELFPACAKKKAKKLEKAGEENMIYTAGKRPRASNIQNYEGRG